MLERLRNESADGNRTTRSERRHIRESGATCPHFLRSTRRRVRVRVGRARAESHAAAPGWVSFLFGFHAAAGSTLAVERGGGAMEDGGGRALGSSTRTRRVARAVSTRPPSGRRHAYSGQPVKQQGRALGSRSSSARSTAGGVIPPLVSRTWLSRISSRSALRRRAASLAPAPTDERSNPSGSHPSNPCRAVSRRVPFGRARARDGCATAVGVGGGRVVGRPSFANRSIDRSSRRRSATRRLVGLWIAADDDLLRFLLSERSVVQVVQAPRVSACTTLHRRPPNPDLDLVHERAEPDRLERGFRRLGRH